MVQIRCIAKIAKFIGVTMKGKTCFAGVKLTALF